MYIIRGYVHLRLDVLRLFLLVERINKSVNSVQLCLILLHFWLLMFLNVDSCSMYWRYKWKNISDIKYDFCVTKPVQDALINIYQYIYMINIIYIYNFSHSDKLARHKPTSEVCMCGVSCLHHWRSAGGWTWSPILSLRSQWSPHSLADKRTQSGLPHRGVPPARGPGGGTSEQLAPRGAADQGRPLPLCRRGRHGKWRVWGGPPPHYRRYLDLELAWLWECPECLTGLSSVSEH